MKALLAAVIIYSAVMMTAMMPSSPATGQSQVVPCSARCNTAHALCLQKEDAQPGGRSSCWSKHQSCRRRCASRFPPEKMRKSVTFD